MPNPPAKPANTGKIPQGFVKSTSLPKPPTLEFSLEGGWSAGKTRLALDAPGPIALLDIDHGTRGVVEQFENEKDIHLYTCDYLIPGRPPSLPKGEKGDEAYQKIVADALLPVWEELRERTEAAAKAARDRVFRTVVIDGAAEAYDLCKMARTGCVEKIPFNMHAQYRIEFEGLIKMLRNSGANVIFCSRLKAQWVNVVNEKTGKETPRQTGFKIRAGWADLEHAFDLSLRVTKPEYFPNGNLREPRTYEFKKCRFAVSNHLEGTLYKGDLSFLELGMMVRPDVDPENWV